MKNNRKNRKKIKMYTKKVFKGCRVIYRYKKGKVSFDVSSDIGPHILKGNDSIKGLGEPMTYDKLLGTLSVIRLEDNGDEQKLYINNWRVQ